MTENGQWKIYRDAPELHGGFTTWALQAKLLDYFTVDGIEVDPYDGARFEGDQLDKLTDQLRDAIVEFRSKDEDWPLSSDDAKAHYEQMKISLVEILPPRDESITVFLRAIELAQLAKFSNEKLQFLGD